jgi:hypothetical protein
VEPPLNSCPSLFCSRPWTSLSLCTFSYHPVSASPTTSGRGLYPELEAGRAVRRSGRSGLTEAMCCSSRLTSESEDTATGTPGVLRELKKGGGGRSTRGRRDRGRKPTAALEPPTARGGGSAGVKSCIEAMARSSLGHARGRTIWPATGKAIGRPWWRAVGWGVRDWPGSARSVGG